MGASSVCREARALVPAAANGRSAIRAQQPDRVFGTGLNTERAAVALVGADRDGLLPAMRKTLQAAHQADPGPLGRQQPADLEYVVGADPDAILLALAALAVDHRRNHAGRLAAVFVSQVAPRCVTLTAKI